MEYPETDVVILNYNGKKFLKECLDSVINCSYPNKKIHVLDNASTDDDVSWLKQHYPQINIIQNKLNNGYCAAYNLGFSTTKGKYIICLNNDVTVHPQWIEHLVKLAEADEKIAAIQPKIVSYFDNKKFEYAGASGGMMDIFGYPFLRGRIFNSIEEDKGQYDNISEIFWTSGAAMFIRKEALEVTDTLDETIVHHMDEIDLCWRMRMCGFKTVVQPLSVIHHIGGATIQTKSFRKVYWNHRNSLYIMLKNYECKNVLRYVPVHFLLDYLVIAQSLIQRDFTTVGGILKAHVWLLLNPVLILRKRKSVQSMRTVADKEVKRFLYNGSIVWEYFGKKRKTCTQLKNYTPYEYSTD